MVADVWFQLDTDVEVSGMVEATLDVRAVSSTSSNSQNLSWGIGYDVWILLQVGSTLPESGGSQTTASENAYGANTGYFTTSNRLSKASTTSMQVSAPKSVLYNRPGSGWTNFSTTHALFFGTGIGGINTMSASYSGQYVYCRAFVRVRDRYGSPGALFVDQPYIKFQGFKK